MDSPCKNCIVDAMCVTPCDKMKEYVRDTIMEFKPEGSPESDIIFLIRTCIRIREHKTVRIRAALCLRFGKFIKCSIYVENRSIKRIEEDSSDCKSV